MIQIDTLNMYILPLSIGQYGDDYTAAKISQRKTSHTATFANLDRIEFPERQKDPLI